MRDNDVSKVVWCMMYSSVVSMGLHPGNNGRVEFDRESRKKFLDFSASLADSMYDAFSRRFESFKE